MIIDSKGKLFGKVSIIDLLIVVIIIGVAAGAYYKFGRSKSATPFTKTESIQTVFYSDDIPVWVADAVKVGDPFKDRITGAYFGKVTKVEKGEDTVFNPNSSGQMIKSSKEGYCSLKVYVEGQGVYSDTGATFGNTEFQIYRQLEFRAGRVASFFRIYSINKAQ